MIIGRRLRFEINAAQYRQAVPDRILTLDSLISGRTGIIIAAPSCVFTGRVTNYEQYQECFHDGLLAFPNPGQLVGTFILSVT